MAHLVRTKATYDDLLEVRENDVGELVDGDLYVSPRPSSAHALASSRLGVELGGPFDRGRGGPGGWIILDEPELHVVGQVVIADLAGWRRQRMPEVPDAAAFELAPDWVCEVLSPSTEAFDRAKKLPVYAKAQVQHVWFVQPDVRTLEVFRLKGPTYEVVRTYVEDKIRAEPFDEVEIELAALWAR